MGEHIPIHIRASAGKQTLVDLLGKEYFLVPCGQVYRAVGIAAGVDAVLGHPYFLALSQRFLGRLSHIAKRLMPVDMAGDNVYMLGRLGIIEHDIRIFGIETERFRIHQSHIICFAIKT